MTPRIDEDEANTINREQEHDEYELEKEERDTAQREAAQYPSEVEYFIY